jgi:hypothetical protein
MAVSYRVQFDDVAGHGYTTALDQGPQAVTVRAVDGKDYAATLTLDDVAGRHVGYLDFASADVEGHGVRWNVDQSPQAVTIKAAGGEELTGTLIAEDDDVEGHHVRKPTDFPNSRVP